MCGICGELSFDPGAVRREVIVAMRDRLVHRGPDDQGCYVDEARQIGLGFRRLAIIDLDPIANQPMPNEDGAVQLVFNGEIYNFQEIRAGLAARGHRFRSHSDSEVIAHLYEEQGERFVETIDGMFAIALWDARRRRLYLARDRAGKKPLFFARTKAGVVFGSEIKSLLAHPAIGIDLDERRIAPFLVHGYVPHPHTLYRGVQQVDPGSIVTVDADGGTASRKYWSLAFSAGASRLSWADAEIRVRELTIEAVRKRLMSDVALGAFLSAGIDSTIVVGLMSRLSAEPVKTFTIGFEGDAAFDETRVARDVAARFGAVHTEFRVKPGAVSLLDTLIWHHDGPFGDSSAIPTFLVSQLTRQHVTVVLTGDGGDEIFAGYDRFRAALLAERLPRPLKRVAAGLLQLAPASPHERHVFARARRFGRYMNLELTERLARWNSIFQEDVADLVEGADAAAADVAAEAGTTDLDRLLSANFASYLPDDLLVKTDRCTMAHSLEARAPFLDTALMEFVATLPDEMKLSGRTTKAILRSAFRDLVPGRVAARPKTGFGVPLDSWFRGELREFAEDTLLSRGAESARYLNRGGVERVLGDHAAGRANYGHRLWTLVCFERWLRLLPSWSAGETSKPPHRPLVASGADAVRSDTPR